MLLKSLLIIASILLCLAYGSYFENLETLMNDYASCPSLQLAGHALVIVKNGRTIYKQVGGLRDVVNNLPVTNDTVFSIGSISKQIASLVLGQLFEEGLIDFDEPVSNYISELALEENTAFQQMTLHDLLTHHTGLARNDFLMMVNNTMNTEQFLAKLGGWPFTTSFRQQATYNSFGYVIARIVIERVTGQNYDEVLKERIFVPLGMNHSYPTTAETLSLEPENYAYGNGLNSNFEVAPIYPRDMNRIFDGLISVAGGVHFSVGDLETYLTALQTQSFPNLTSTTFRSVAAQKTRSVAPRTLDLTVPFGLYFALYSYGFMNGDYHGHRYFAHNGATIGSTSYILTYPNDGISIGLMTNNHNINSLSYFLLFTQIFDIVSGNSYDNSTTCLFSTTTVLLPKTGYPNASVENRDQYTGTYLNSVYGSIVVSPSTENNDELILNFGSLTGKLRPNGVNKFLWFTENSFEGQSLTFTFYFNPSAIKAKSLSVNLDSTVPDFVFKKGISE